MNRSIQLNTMAATWEVVTSPNYFPYILLSRELVSCFYLSLIYDLFSLVTDFSMFLIL